MIMKILLVNDDGVRARGIRALYDALKDLFDVTVVAPDGQRSIIGHAMSLDRPLRLKKIQEHVYSCDGYPADCALLGMVHILKGKKIDLVISGINDGGNMGQDLFYSGTVAAAREASFQGNPAISISVNSEFHTENSAHFETAATVMRQLIDEKIHTCIPELAILNINVPNLPLNEIKGVAFTVAGFRQYAQEIVEVADPRNRSCYWLAGKHSGHRNLMKGNISDCDAIEQDIVSVSLHGLKTITDNEESAIISVLERVNLLYLKEKVD